MNLTPRVRSLVSSAVLLVGLVLFALALHRYYPLQRWLFFRYLAYWLSCGLMASACFSLGYRVVRWLGGSTVRLSERLLLGFAAGVFVFALGIFIGGLFGLFGTAFFFGWPLLMLALAGKRTFTALRSDLARAFRRGREAGSFFPRTYLEWMRWALLGLGLIAVYTQVITPENVSFDSRWYHLGLADQYSAQGGIRRFAEGWYLAAYPQLAVWLYTWAFQLPGTLFDHVALAAHVEFTIFLATLPGIGLLVRRMVPGLRVRWASAATFLFPSLLLYDSNLNVGADHILAFWAIPLALTLCILRRATTSRSVLLVAMMASAALLTKYQSIYLITPAALAVLVMLVRVRRFGLLAQGTAAVLVLTAPHWLKNLLFHGDPLYPMLYAHLPGQPFHPGARAAMDGGFLPGNFILQGTLGHKLVETAKTLATFAFWPHNWKGFDVPEPTFGALFSLFVPVLPFLSGMRRVWLLVASTYLGVAIWFWTNHQDRYLQALLPWMIVTVVVASAKLWRFGGIARFSVALLIAFQLISGSDIYFYPTHRMIRDVPVKSLADFLSAQKRKQYDERFVHWGETSAVEKTLPRDAVVLVHDKFLRLGISRAMVGDEWGFQGELSYRELGSTRAVWQAWRDLGVTHVVWAPSKISRPDVATLARQMVFYEAAVRASRKVWDVNGFKVAELSPTPPSEQRRLLGIAGCGGDPPSGTYLVMPKKNGRALKAVPAEENAQATVVAARAGCGSTSPALQQQLRRDFEKAADLGGLVIWVLKK